jgi:hypothetical protein
VLLLNTTSIPNQFLLLLTHTLKSFIRLHLGIDFS